MSGGNDKANQRPPALAQKVAAVETLAKLLLDIPELRAAPIKIQIDSAISIAVTLAYDHPKHTRATAHLLAMLARNLHNLADCRLGVATPAGEGATPKPTTPTQTPPTIH